MKLFLTLLVCLAVPVLWADPTPDFFFTQYEPTHLDFLRQYYDKINNGRMIQTEGSFVSAEWEKPYLYREKLRAVGIDVDRFNILKFTFKDKDDFHYDFPLMLFPVESGDLSELKQLYPGERLVVYGKFYNLDDSEYALLVHVLETVQKGGHDRDILLDARMSPTPTVTPTVTPTPGPNLWKRLQNAVNPKEEPTGTVTPNAGP